MSNNDKKYRYLITGVGGPAGIGAIKCLQKANMAESIIGVDANNMAPGLNFVDKFYSVPRCNESSYLHEMHTICKNENIDIILPTVDEEIRVFSNLNPNDYLKKLMLVPNKNCVDIANDKYICSKILSEVGVKIPSTYSQEDVMTTEIKYPVICKPRIGSGSRGISKISDLEMLGYTNRYRKDIYYQEFIEGTLYSVDTCFNRNNINIGIVPRKLISSSNNGFSNYFAKAWITVDDSDIIDTVRLIGETLKLVGCANLQFIRGENNDLYFIEVNCRWGGWVFHSANAGINFPQLLSKIIKEDNTENQQYNFIKDVIMYQYLESIFEMK